MAGSKERRTLKLVDGNIVLTLDKIFSGKASRTAQTYCLSGEIHNIPWERYLPVMDGFAAIAAEIMSLSPSQIETASALEEVPGGGLKASFSLRAARDLTDVELEAFWSAASAYVQRLTDTDKQVVLDLFATERPEVVELGVRVAEEVRRAAAGSNLPVRAELQAGTASPIGLRNRIGRHPDPECDLEERALCGRVIAIDTEKHRIEIREAPAPAPAVAAQGELGGLAGNAPSRRGQQKGRRLKVQYDIAQWEEHVLRLPLGRPQSVSIKVLPKRKGARERLMLQHLSTEIAAEDSKSSS